MSDLTKKLEQILANGGKSTPQASTLNLIGMVRECKNKENLEFALDNTGRWVQIEKKLVESVEQLGILELNNQSFAVVDLVIRRPDVNSAWFDLLEFVLIRASSVCNQTANHADESSCNCGKQNIMVPRMRPLGPPNTGKCFACWIFTVGTGADFCYRAGAC